MRRTAPKLAVAPARSLRLGGTERAPVKIQVFLGWRLHRFLRIVESVYLVCLTELSWLSGNSLAGPRRPRHFPYL